MGFVASAGAISAIDEEPLAGMGGSRSLVRRPAGVTNFLGWHRSYEAIYASQPAVRTVVSFLGKNVGQLNFKLYRRKSASERIEEREHPVARAMRYPDPTLRPRQSRSAWMRALVEDLGIFDVFIALKVSAVIDGRQRIALRRIPPQNVTPIGNSWLDVDGFRIEHAGKRVELPSDNFVFIRGYSPIDSRWGLSPIETLRQILAEEAAAGDFREQLWRNGARRSGVITRPADAPKWSDNARERFRQSWRDRYTGDGPEAGGTPILEDGMTYANDVFNPSELEYLGARKLSRQEVFSAYHVELPLEAAANVSDSAHTRLYQDNLAPLTTFIQQELTVQLVADVDGVDALDELYIEADLDAKLTGDFATEAEAASRATGGPWLTRNEQRARRNLPPVDGGDELIVPLNVTTGGRGSPADTAPGTPGLGQAARRALGAAKAVEASAIEAFPTELAAWVEKTHDELVGFVERQRSSVFSKLGRGDDPATAFGRNAEDRMPRWDNELTDLFAGLALEVAGVTGAPVAETFDVEYDLDVATPWLLNNARIAAETFNDATFLAVADLWPAPNTRSRRRKDVVDLAVEEPEVPVIGDAFDLAAGIRALRASIDRVGVVDNFARQDAASQAGATTKTWRTRSPNARASHAALDGVTVPAGETFPNGGRWPHDPALPADEKAGCTCTVEFTEAAVS